RPAGPAPGSGGAGAGPAAAAGTGPRPAGRGGPAPTGTRRTPAAAAAAPSGNRGAAAERTARAVETRRARGTSLQERPLQPPQEEVLEPRVRRHPHVVELVGATEPLDAGQEPRQLALVGPERLGVHRDLADLAGLRVDQLEVTAERRV